MSSHVVVIATDLRRTTVKVNPGTYLTDVLEQACRKFNLSSDRYLIKHKQKQVDLSIPFRASGLVPGAKLELVQKSNTPSAIQVALQVPPPEGREIPGGRLIQKFPSNLTIWKVLRQFESGKASNGKNVNITARGVAETSNSAGTGSGQLYYEVPVLNIMGRELSNFADFQKTLSQLGYNSGSVLIRLGYRKTGQTLFDAMSEIGDFFKEADEEESKISTQEESNKVEDKKEPEVEPTPSTVVETSIVEPAQETPDIPMVEAEAQIESAQESATTSQPAQQEEPQPSATQDDMVVDTLESKDPYQPVNVFLAPTGTTPAAALAAPDETDYVPSIAHAQLHQARLLESTRNKRLLSDKQLEEKATAEAEKIASVKSILIKVRFPDNTSSEWQVGPAETGGFLYEAVRYVMANPSQPFRLTLPGGKQAIKDSSDANNTLIKAYKLSGRVLVNLVWDDKVPPTVRKQPFLKSNIAQQGQQIKVPEVPQGVDEKDDAPATTASKPERGEGSGDKLGKKIPKWLKLGKK